ncbi:hypothetical protein DPMN_024583, partial [Dreissena polymorpha]
MLFSPHIGGTRQDKKCVMTTPAFKVGIEDSNLRQLLLQLSGTLVIHQVLEG